MRRKTRAYGYADPLRELWCNCVPLRRTDGVGRSDGGARNLPIVSDQGQFPDLGSFGVARSDVFKLLGGPARIAPLWSILSTGDVRQETNQTSCGCSQKRSAPHQRK